MGIIKRFYRKGKSAVTRIILSALPTYPTTDILPVQPRTFCPPEPVTGTRQQITAPSSRSAVPVPTSVGTATAAIVVFDSIKPEAVHDLPVNLGDAETLPRPCQGDADLPVSETPALPEASQPDAVEPVAVNDANLLGLPDDLLKDFATLRKAKKRAPAITKTEAVFFASEAAKAGLTTAQAVRESIMRGWGRFEAKWLPAAKPLEAPTAVYRPEVQQPVSPEVISAAKANLAALRERLKSTPTDPLASARQIMAAHDRGEHVNAARLQFARAALDKGATV